MPRSLLRDLEKLLQLQSAFTKHNHDVFQKLSIKEDLLGLENQKEQLDAFIEQFQNFSHFGHISILTVWEIYGASIEKINASPIYELEEECIDLFSRLKLASIKLRSEATPSGMPSGEVPYLLDDHFSLEDAYQNLMLDLKASFYNTEGAKNKALSQLKDELRDFYENFEKHQTKTQLASFAGIERALENA